MKSFRASVITGSSLVSTNEDIRGMLDVAQEVFLNKAAFSTHATRGPAKWAIRTIELDSDYPGPSELDVELSFMPKPKPKRLKPIALPVPAPALSSTTNTTTVTPTLKDATIREAAVRQSADSVDSLSVAAPAVTSSSSPRAAITATPALPTLPKVKAPRPGRTVKLPLEPWSIHGPGTLSHPVSAPVPVAEDQSLARQRAQERVLRKMAEDRKALVEQEEEKERKLQDKLLKNEIKIRSLTEKTLERVSHYHMIVAQREEALLKEKAEQEKVLESDQQKVHSDDYMEKMKQLRIDAKRRMMRFQSHQLAQLSEAEQTTAKQLAAVRQAKNPHTTYRPRKRPTQPIYVHNVDEGQEQDLAGEADMDEGIELYDSLNDRAWSAGQSTRDTAQAEAELFSSGYHRLNRPATIGSDERPAPFPPVQYESKGPILGTRKAFDENPDKLYNTNHLSPIDKALQKQRQRQQREDDSSEDIPLARQRLISRESSSSDFSDITVEEHRHPTMKPAPPKKQATLPALPTAGLLGSVKSPSQGLPPLPSVSSGQSSKKKTRKFQKLAPIPIAAYQPIVKQY